MADQSQDLLAILESDPEWQQIKASGMLRTDSAANTYTHVMRDILKRHGMDTGNNYVIDPHTLQPKQAGAFSRNADWIMPLALGGVAGLAPGAAGAFGGGAAAAGGGGASLAAAPTIPTVGLEGLGAITGVPSTLGGAAGAAGATTAGSTIAGLTAPAIESSAIPGGAAASAASEAPVLWGGATAPGAATGGSIMHRLMNPDNLSELGNVLGGASEGEANNRISRGSLSQGYDRLKLAAEENKRSAESDAIKKLYQTGYLASGGRPYTPNAAAPVDFGFGPKATTADQRTGANELRTQLLDRLKPGGTYEPTPLDSYANRGTLENATNTGGLIAGGVGAAMDIFGNPKTPQNPNGSKINRVVNAGRTIAGLF